jgi:hypothetical protein
LTLPVSQAPAKSIWEFNTGTSRPGREPAFKVVKKSPFSSASRRANDEVKAAARHDRLAALIFTGAR